MSAPSAKTTTWRLAALLWPYLVLVAARLVFGAQGYYPVLQPDEVIYREAARFFAGVGPLPNLADGYLFPMGYPLLVAPLFWFFDTLAGLGGALLLLNALVASTVYFPVRFLLTRLSKAPSGACTAAALVTGLYPAHFALTSLWATDNAFVPLFVLLAAAAWRLFESPSAPRAMLFGGLAAALYCVHERALLIIAVAAAQLVWMGLRGHLRRRDAGIGLGVLSAGFAGVRWITTHAVASLYRGEPVERPLGVVLSKLLDLEGWIDVFLQAAGQGWYLLVATYGLGGIGLVVLLNHLSRHRNVLLTPANGSDAGTLTAGTHTALFLVLSAAAVFGTTVVYFPQNPIMSLKPEFFFFGRICEGVMAMFLALGLASLASTRPVRRIPTTLLAWSGATVALGAIMVAGRGMKDLSDGPGSYGVFGVRWFLRDETWQIHPVAGTLVLFAAVAAIAWLLRRRPLPLMALVGLSFLWVSSDISIHYMGRRLERLYSRALPAQLERAGGAAEIAFDTRAMRVGRYAELVRQVEAHQFSSRDDGRPPTQLVLTYRNWGAARSLGASFLVGERDRKYALWALPGPEADRLYRPPDYHRVVFGAQAVWSVWEEGFEEQEFWRDSAPTRWTDGDAQITIPLGDSRPAVLRLDIASTGPQKTTLTVRTEDGVRFRRQLTRDGWNGDLQLQGRPLGKELSIKLESERVYEYGRRHGFSNRWKRGVLVRGITLLDLDELAIEADPTTRPGAAPVRYRLELPTKGAPRWATTDAPLVIVATVTNAGDRAWRGSTVPGAWVGPRLQATWRAQESAEVVQVPLPRPLLPGRSLDMAMAVSPVDRKGEALAEGEYIVDLTLVSSAGAEAGPALELPVQVRRHRPDRPFAPLRVLARHDPLPPPHFVLMPSDFNE